MKLTVETTYKNFCLHFFSLYYNKGRGNNYNGPLDTSHCRILGGIVHTDRKFTGKLFSIYSVDGLRAAVAGGAAATAAAAAARCFNLI